MRKAIIFATHNAHKIEEVAAILSPLGVQVIGGDECNLPDVEETGKTFEENLNVVLNGTTINTLYTSSTQMSIADGKAMQIIYNNGANVSDALKKIELGFPQSEERDTILKFIRESKRGIIRSLGSESKGNID